MIKKYLRRTLERIGLVKVLGSHVRQAHPTTAPSQICCCIAILVLIFDFNMIEALRFCNVDPTCRSNCSKRDPLINNQTVINPHPYPFINLSQLKHICVHLWRNGSAILVQDVAQPAYRKRSCIRQSVVWTYTAKGKECHPCVHLDTFGSP